MKKYLIRTVLVLAAITACNKEVETHVVDNGQEEVTPGMVTMTFTAAMGEETRTAYPDDKTGKWVVGDQITVCVTKDVTDGEQRDYKLYNFTATGMSGELMEFSGSVKDGYTTIVSGIYPVSNKTVLDDGEVVSNHVFTAGAVTSVYLPDTYNLGTANDGGIALPMVGEMVVPEGSETPTFTFHHICGALKIEVIDIFNALTFTTAESITGNFPLNSEGRIAIPANGSGSTVTFNYDRLATNIAGDERGNRTFYIPVPDGTLTAGATMALKKGNDLTTVFEKSISSNVVFASNINVIKRLPKIGFNTPEGWAIDIIDGNVGQKITINYTFPAGTYYARFLVKKSTFINTYEGSVAKLIEKKLPELSTFSNNTYNGSNVETYFAEKDYISFMIGVIPSDPSNLSDKTGRLITFEYCKLEYSFEEPTQAFQNWIGKWSVTEDATDPKTDTWTISTKKANSTYIIKGIAGKTAIAAEGVYSAADASLTLLSQPEIGTLSGHKVSLLRRNNNTSGTIAISNGEYFGEADLLSAADSTVSVRSVTDSVFLVLDTPVLESLIEEIPDFR
ncbi:MAG: cyclic nucleotide-binding domain-containing protein, partial [Lachnospiraceae bacterium]|nr:cyclic nucleotide-binding domain-containing protein [Lachnospiraceae bacterium]